VKIGLMTDSVAELSLEEVLGLSVEVGIEALEFGTGNWSSAPHVDLERLNADSWARAGFLRSIHDCGLEISALNCSGNPLHGGEVGRKDDRITRDTIRLAGALGVERVVLMSGCPPAPGDTVPNWITVAWPPELAGVLAWQWDTVLIPYWRDLAAFATSHGVRKLCLEMHGHQAVYNVRTFARLRDAVGDIVGINFDPSHLFWMGADPIAAIRALGDAICHVHAKDTRIEAWYAAPNGLLETAPNESFRERSWNFATLGYGHDQGWWSTFAATLASVGYDNVVSIEHEDGMMPPVEGVRKAVHVLDAALVRRRQSLHRRGTSSVPNDGAAVSKEADGGAVAAQIQRKPKGEETL